MTPPLTRRALLKGAAGLGATVLLPGCGSSSSGGAGSDAAAPTSFPLTLDFSALPDAEGWPAGWVCNGVANLRVLGGQGVLEAGTDVFPCDPRPLVFAADARALELTVRATVLAAGSGVGLVLRRVSPHDFYALLFEPQTQTLRVVRRSGFDLVTLAVSPAPVADRAFTLEFSASGRAPTQLRWSLILDGVPVSLTVQDGADPLQQPGDAGVLGHAQTLLPSGSAVFPALGNARLLPYGVQEGEAFLQTPAGQAFIETIRRRSTTQFGAITLESPEAPQPTAASVIAATTGAPRPGGARLQLACDLPAAASIEVASREDFSDARMIDAGHTGDYEGLVCEVPAQGETTYWRPRLERGGIQTLGPVRSFRRLPAAGAGGRYSFAFGACASQFGPIFDDLTARAPDLFVWLGDLNYPDTMGPFAQSFSGYAGIWRHFLDNPRLAALLARSYFVGGRDDHDYAVQDANAATLKPWALGPWDALMNPVPYQQLRLGAADLWLLDQRQWKDDPTLADTPEKTLLGKAQRHWLFETLAASNARFKIIGSPCTLATGGNGRDGSWASGFESERDLLLNHIRDHVSGTTLFLTGDTHFTMLYEKDGLFELRPCPLDIPLPNDQSISNPDLEFTFGKTPGVSYWSRKGHYALATVEGAGSDARLQLDLIREDGVIVQTRNFGAPAA